MEVLVAVAILGIGLGILLELFSGGLRSAKISEEVTKAQWFGKVKMEEILNAKDLSEGVTEDTFDSQFSWKSEVTKNNPALGQDDTAGSTTPGGSLQDHCQGELAVRSGPKEFGTGISPGL